MKSFDELSLKEIVNEVKDGCILGVPADYSGVPMEFTKRLIEKGIKDYVSFLKLNNYAK